MNLRTELERLLTPPELDFCLLAGELAASHGVQLWLTGGLVRDVLLGKGSKDLDISFCGNMNFPRILSQIAKLRIVRSFPRYGCFVLQLSDGARVDMLPLRRETYPEPAGVPQIECISSLEKDLLRRDYTVNAMAISLEPHTFGQLIDFYGGLTALKKRELHLLHEDSFFDDPVRIFRGIRFATRLGFSLSEDSYRVLCHSHNHHVLKTLSPGVCLRELETTFKSCSFPHVFSVMRKWHFFSAIGWPGVHNHFSSVLTASRLVEKVVFRLREKQTLKVAKVRWQAMLSVLVLFHAQGREFFLQQFSPGKNLVKTIDEVYECAGKIMSWFTVGCDGEKLPFKRPRKAWVKCGAVVLALLQSPDYTSDRVDQIIETLV